MEGGTMNLQQQEEKHDPKAVAENIEHVSRKVKGLDHLISHVNSRFQDATDNLVRMRHDLENKQKNIAFLQQARDALQKKVDTNKAKAHSLRISMRKAEKTFASINSDMQKGSREAMHGDGASGGSRLGLRQVNGRLVSGELQATRGYSCAPGSTPAADAATPLPRLAR